MGGIVVDKFIMFIYLYALNYMYYCLGSCYVIEGLVTAISEVFSFEF